MIIRNPGKVVERMVEAGERDLEHLLLHIIIVHVNSMDLGFIRCGGADGVSPRVPAFFSQAWVSN